MVVHARERTRVRRFPAGELGIAMADARGEQGASPWSNESSALAFGLAGAGCCCWQQIVGDCRGWNNKVVGSRRAARDGLRQPFRLTATE